MTTGDCLNCVVQRLETENANLRAFIEQQRTDVKQANRELSNVHKENLRIEGRMPGPCYCSDDLPLHKCLHCFNELKKKCVDPQCLISAEHRHEVVLISGADRESCSNLCF